MNIDSKTIDRIQDKTVSVNSKSNPKETDSKFKDELQNAKPADKPAKETEKETKDSKSEKETNLKEDVTVNTDTEVNKENMEKALDDLSSTLIEINQSDEKKSFGIKNILKPSDNNDIGENLINNDFNIQDKKDILPQMNSNMNFGGDGQPFSSLMDNHKEPSNDRLPSSAEDLAEENAILSTLAENIAMVNKANIQEPSEKIVNKNNGIKKIDTQTGITKETIVKYDSIVMNEADVEVFADLVQNGSIDINNLAPEAAKKSVQVSKTLADMLAKAMEDNKPVRIDFDNNISVIIKISRDGKISADFLPSSQVAEAYLKENLPLLKQRFEEQNIDYDELNRRERRNKEQDNNRKKGRENE